MPQLVQRRVGVGRLRRELTPLRQHHPVLGQAVVRPVASHVIDPDPAVADQGLGPLVPVPFRRRGRERPQVQAFGLLDFEDVLDLDERPVAPDPVERWPPRLIEHRLALVVAGRHAPLPLDVHDRCPRLALAYTGAGPGGRALRQAFELIMEAVPPVEAS